MPNPYVGSNITGCNSPAIGADKTEYPATLDTLAERMDAHDHTTTKGLQIPTGGFVDDAIITSKIVNDAVRTVNLVTGAVTEAKIGDSAVTPVKRAAINRVISSFSASVGLSSTGSDTIFTFPTTAAITSDGSKPIRVYLANGNDNTGNVASNPAAHINFSNNNTKLTFCEFQLFRGVTRIDSLGFGFKGSVKAPLGMIKWYDNAPTVGVNIYTLKIKYPSGALAEDLTTLLLVQTALVAEEL